MEKGRFHAVEEVHSHGNLMNHLKLLRPHERVAGQETVQGSITHVLHHNSGGFAAHSVDGNNVLAFELGNLGHFIYYFPVIEKQ